MGDLNEMKREWKVTPDVRARPENVGTLMSLEYHPVTGIVSAMWVPPQTRIHHQDVAGPYRLPADAFMPLKIEEIDIAARGLTIGPAHD